MRNLSSCRPFNWSMGQRSSGLEWILKRPGMSELRMCALASAILKKTLQEESKSAAVLISRHRIPLFMPVRPFWTGMVFLWKETPPISSNIEVRANRFGCPRAGTLGAGCVSKGPRFSQAEGEYIRGALGRAGAYGVLAANKASL